MEKTNINPMQQPFVKLYTEDGTEDGFEIEYEILPPIKDTDPRRAAIAQGRMSVDEQLAIINEEVANLNAEIERLTNRADVLDYMVAVGSGVLTGIIDILFVDDFSLDKANKWGDEKTNNFVVKIAKFQGYKGDDLPGAVKFLEDKFPIAADKATNDFGGGRQHHLRDFSHHPTPVGLFFSFLTQFTHKVYGTDTAGMFKIVELKEADLVLVGENFQEKITFGIVNWFFHIVSDLAGSSGSILEGKVGTGLPGPITSLLKEVSALPFFRSLNENGYKEFSVWISKLFNGTLLGERDKSGNIISPGKFDFRTELGVAAQLGQQAIPVVINECIVRGFYFIRRLFSEIKANDIKRIHDLGSINWHNTLPFKNGTIVRMLTISTGTMTAIDLADAAIESAVKTGGFGPAFVSGMLVKVNFVGIGRFAVAVGTDVCMGIKKSRKEAECTALYAQQIKLLNAKIYYQQADMWLDAENAGKAIEEAYQTAQKAIEKWCNSVKNIFDELDNIDDISTSDMESADPGLREDLYSILEY